MAKVFYARVSSSDQDLDVQLAEAKRVKAFAEKQSGLDSDRTFLINAALGRGAWSPTLTPGK